MILRHRDYHYIMMTAMIDPEVKDDHDNVCLAANLFCLQIPVASRRVFLVG